MIASIARTLRAALLAVLPLLGACSSGDSGKGTRLILATTHTLEDSGILDTLTAAFRAAHPEYDLQVVLGGSGEVLALGQRRDADVLLTHAPQDEESFVSHGHGMDRHSVMHNDFVLVGPPADPYAVGAAATADEAFRRLRLTGAPFVSRGDDSGTHKKEKRIWEMIGVTPDWQHYVEAGVGMADALRLAAQQGYYILSDRATFMNLRKELPLDIIFEGDPVLRNQYSVTIVTDANNKEGASAFVEWVTGPEARALIASYGRQRFGRQVFFPDSADAAP